MSTERSLRLLVVEDDIIDRKLLQRLLGKTSLKVAQIEYADRLSTAVDMVGTSSFDLVLLDLGLPDSRGTESVIELQMHAPHVPIVVLSGLDDEETAITAMQKGVQDYLIKGQIDSTLLMRSIRYALERKKAEGQLQAAEQRYRTIFENSAVAIMMADKEKRLVSWNNFTEQLLGMGRDDLLGYPVRSLYPPAEWERICALSICQKGMQHHLDTQMVRKGGQVVDVDISISVLRGTDGQVTGSIGVVRDITERKQMEEALRESENRFRQIAANAKEWIWEVNADGLYTYASPIVEEILGYKPEEILGKKYFHDFFHPEEKDRWKAESFEIFTRRDEFSEFQTRNIHRDGRVVWLLRSGVPILDSNQKLRGYRGADVDMTERMRIHGILDRKQKNLEAIFDAVPVGMLLVNEQMVVVRANEAVRQMSGRDFCEIINRGPCAALACIRGGDDSKRCTPPRDQCGNCSLKTMIELVLESGNPIRGLEVNLTLDDNGTEVSIWLLVSVEPVTIDSGKHVVVALNDITDRKRAEEELKETMEMKSQFVSTVSHELRTPLTSIREAVIILLDGVAGSINKDQKHFLAIANRNIDRLGRLIDDVLDFQKLNAGKMTFELKESSIESVIEDAYTTMCPYAEKRRVHLSMDVAGNLPKVMLDGDRMIQVLTNLVSNAIKFTPEEGQISISSAQRDDHLCVRVSDTGYGIPKESLPRIFERFYRVHRPGKEIKGTGLGLAIVSKIVAGHGGRIEVESEPNKGTTFTVLLPLTPASASGSLAQEEDQWVEETLATNQPLPLPPGREIPTP